MRSFVFLLMLNSIFFSVMSIEVGYVCVPVADLVAQPFKENAGASIAEQYDALVLSPERGKKVCLRVHQALFNERVLILGSENQQLYVELTHCCVQSAPYRERKPVRVWTRADWIVSENELSSLGIESSLFAPVEYQKPSSLCDKNVITLVAPWHDSISGYTYSAGTRFVVHEQSSSEGFIVAFYNHRLQHHVISVIPQSLALCSSAIAEKRSAFIALLRFWCSLEGVIPFVWGGASFVTSCDGNFLLHEQNSKESYWERPSLTQRPYCGFDAATLILRAAQIVGIPYFCLNSMTILNSLPLLQRGDSLEEGDIVWAPGYVGIVGTLQNNEIIEMQGYSRGYGTLHALPLQKRYKDIYTWDDFLYWYDRSLPLQSLDSKGNVVTLLPNYIIFKLPI